MRLGLLAILPLCALLTVPAAGRQDFPYKAYVTADDVYVRGGPGENYYPTGKLHTGDEVEVYRHDPGGWYAIRPPEESFTWVSGRYLKLDEEGLAEVTGDRVAARVGSQFSDIRDVIQVRLHRGELVEVLDSDEFGSGPGAETWYRIAPPSGEFRWIFGKYVAQEPPPDGVRHAPADHSPLIQASRGGSDPVPSTPPATAAEQTTQKQGDLTVEQSGSQTRTAEHWTPLAGQTSAENSSATADPELYTNKFVNPATDPAGSVTMRRISPQEFQTELDDVEMELSIMLVEEPTAWVFDELGMRARWLLTQAETAPERGRARALVNRIEQSQDIKARYDAVATMRTQTERHNRQLSQLSRARSGVELRRESEDRFDGTGRLARVVSQKLGAPQYALVDEKGGVQCYVTPAPGVNMQYYLGRQVGVTGIRGYIAEKRAQHVMAKHVSALEDPALR